MPQKNTKIDDVKRPEKVTPSATSRPILVSGQASAPTDPMMAPADGEKGDAAQVMSHTAKTITPLSDAKPVAEETKPEPAQQLEPTAGPATDVSEAKPVVAKEAPANPAPEAKTDEPKSSASTASERADTIKTDEDTDRDPDAALSAEEAAAAEAKAKRDEELEALIDSGKYAVPINAVQRRQSRMNSLLLTLLAVLLALVLLDAIADVGIVKLPDSIPHTHFFSGR